jgi:hypothetical protein
MKRHDEKKERAHKLGPKHEESICKKEKENNMVEGNVKSVKRCTRKTMPRCLKSSPNSMRMTKKISADIDDGLQLIKTLTGKKATCLIHRPTGSSTFAANTSTTTTTPASTCRLGYGNISYFILRINVCDDLFQLFQSIK